MASESQDVLNVARKTVKKMRVEMRNKAGALVDVSAWTGRAVIAEHKYSESILAAIEHDAGPAFTLYDVKADDGSTNDGIELTWSATQTDQIPGSKYWEIHMVNPAGDGDVQARGIFQIVPRPSAIPL